MHFLEAEASLLNRLRIEFRLLFALVASPAAADITTVRAISA